MHARLLERFLNDRDVVSFLRLRDEVLQHPDFDAADDALAELDAAANEERHRDVLRLHDALGISALLSPSAILCVAQACIGLGRDEEAERLLRMAAAILDGLQSAGDGSAMCPWLVTQLTDETDLLEARGERAQRRQRRRVGGRVIDVVTTESGRVFLFCVTGLLASVERRKLERLEAARATAKTLRVKVRRLRRDRSVAILELSGDLDDGVAKAFVAGAARLVRDGVTRIVIDLDRVETTDAPGLRAVAAVADGMTKRGGDAVTIDLADRLGQLLGDAAPLVASDRDRALAWLLGPAISASVSAA